jgi:exodeoxyribonuclease III
VLAWLADAAPDVLVLQETKLTDDKFPHADLQSAGYASHWFGQKTYNGVALLCKAGRAVEAVQKNIPGFEDEQARVIAASVDGVRVVGGYFPNGQSPDSDKFAYKMRWLAALRTWLQAELAAHPQLVLMGDFNIAPEDRDAYDPVALAGTIHLTTEERAHFQALLGLGLVDAFRLFEQAPKLYSWWDYRNLALRKNQGLRIDHILVSEALRPRVTACHIDKGPRRNERPSDHTPVVVELSS